MPVAGACSGRGQVGIVRGAAEWTRSKTPFCLQLVTRSAFAGRRERDGAAGRVPQDPGWAGLGLEMDAGRAGRPESVPRVRAAAMRPSLVALGVRQTDLVSVSAQVVEDR